MLCTYIDKSVYLYYYLFKAMTNVMKYVKELFEHETIRIYIVGRLS